MKVRRINNYPWYQELVSLFCLFSVLFSAAQNWSILPSPMASHFDWEGRANGFSTPGRTLGLILFLLLLTWLTDSVIRYHFLLAEKTEKRFNWLAFVTLPSVILVAVCWHQLVEFNLRPEAPFLLNWPEFALWSALALGYNAFTEKTRAQALVAPAGSLPEPGLERELPERFCLVSTESPRWWVILCLVSALLMLVSGVLMVLAPEPIVYLSGWLTLVGAIIMLIAAGGLRFVVHSQGVEVSVGFYGIPLSTIPKEQIRSVELLDYSPMADFGGWGIRLGKDKTVGYIVTGEQGVLIKTDGKSYLLGTGKAASFHDALSQLLER